ncbi:hypothetical protein F5883DRAFT_695256 [Diaporthe sp. PMI_573]|nr:hypothetical protein F5883DRAFT_695256 [Diaporthaceae sp. PMI_573]
MLYPHIASSEYGQIVTLPKRDLHEDIAFARSETGFSNSDIMLDWLRHFNQHSFGYHADFKRLGVTLEEWFGIDHLFCFDWRVPEDPPEMAKGRRASEGTIWRALFLDGFAGHYSIEVVTYAHRFNILLIFLPPHSTHKPSSSGSEGALQRWKSCMAHIKQPASTSVSCLLHTKNPSHDRDIDLRAMKDGHSDAYGTGLNARDIRNPNYKGEDSVVPGGATSVLDSPVHRPIKWMSIQVWLLVITVTLLGSS